MQPEAKNAQNTIATTCKTLETVNITTLRKPHKTTRIFLKCQLVKSSQIYLKSAFHNTDCIKAAS